MTEKIRQSIRKNKKGICLMIVSSVCVCIGQLLWKLTATQGLPMMLLGFFFYGLGALVMLVAYRYGKVSILQPMLSMNYVLSIILGAIILREDITLLKLIGVAVITLGVVFIAGGDSE